MIAIYGGTFDPIHIGHTRLASSAIRECELDKLIFMPAYISPFKLDKKVSSAKDRINMIEAALAYYRNHTYVEHPDFLEHVEVSDYEATKGEPSYTIETLEEFRKQYPAEDIAFVLGFDSLLQIDTWYRGEEILRTYPLISALRPEPDSSDEEDLALYRSGLHKVDEFRKKYNARITILSMEPVDASSTEIRNLARDGKPLNGMVLPNVEEYIHNHELYTSTLDDFQKYLTKDIHELEDFLFGALKPSRLKHSIGVQNMARKLARIYGLDEMKAGFAGRYHDLAKCYDNDHMNELIRRYSMPDEYLNNNAIAHSKIACEILQHEFGVEDEDILLAISYHTTGRKEMSLFEEIVYVADAIEENRSYDELQMLQDKACTDLHWTCLYIMDYTIDRIRSQGREVHIDTTSARRYFASQVAECSH